MLARSYYYLGDHRKAIAYFERMLLPKESDVVGHRINAIRSMETLRSLMQQKNSAIGSRTK
ncbi:MAG: tetratricopeptide repeat-containing protein [Desulfuromonadales bacterium]|nr:tetratricopeptide repeat-containing protein [Desulfuromonadales bacterium]